ncbi:MAG: hypothetical protein OXD47_05850 [Gammaproteobacteria bacterium]|nr:hypothetical protein [Gammaproteobacteria bacterium]
MLAVLAAPAGATSDSYCQEQARKLVQAGAGNTNPANSRWTGARCYHEGQFNSENENTQNIEAARRNHPEARAVYYGTPPAEMGAATASIGRNQICITMPSQESKLTSRHRLREIEVYGGDGNYNADVVLTDNGSNYGSFLHFGDIRLGAGMQCVPGKGRFQNAVVGTEFPISLRPKLVGARIDASNPNHDCNQGGSSSTQEMRRASERAQGRCLQWHYAFRRMPHCAASGGSLAAVSCRIWVTVRN